jgi:hypothetical protein
LWRATRRFNIAIATSAAVATNAGVRRWLHIQEEHPTPDSLNRLTHEYVLKDDLDGTWATRPQRLVRAGVRIMLTLGFLGGQALDRLIGPRVEVGRLVSGWNGEELDLACP